MFREFPDFGCQNLGTPVGFVLDVVLFAKSPVCAMATSGVPMGDFPLGAGDFQAFPAQLYFMSFGPWMSNGMLLLQGALAALLGAWLAGRLLYSRPS